MSATDKLMMIESILFSGGAEVKFDPKPKKKVCRRDYNTNRCSQISKRSADLVAKRCPLKEKLGQMCEQSKRKRCKLKAGRYSTKKIGLRATKIGETFGTIKGMQYKVVKPPNAKAKKAELVTYEVF